MACAVDFFLSQFDTAPVIRATLLSPDGKTPINLTGATVRLSLRPANDATTATGGIASIVGDPTLGVVSYQWQPVDVAVAGNFNAEWIVTFPGSHEMTWPNDRYLRIEIKPRLDPLDTPPTPSPLVGTLAVLVSLDTINTGGQQLVALSTTSLANGTEAWVESVHDYFTLEKTGTAFTPDNISIVAGLGGGQWFRRGFTLPVTVDPSSGGGLALPIGSRVRKADASAAWDKFGAAATSWAQVGAGGSPTPPVGALGTLLSLSGINTGAARLVNVPTTTLANGSLAWCQLEDRFFRLNAASTAVVDGVNVVAALNGGRWLEFGGGSMSTDIALAQPPNPGAGGTAIILDTTMVGGVTLSQRAARLDIRTVPVAIKLDVAARFFIAWLDPTSTSWVVYNADPAGSGPGEPILANTAFSRIVECRGLDTLIYIVTTAAPTLWQVMAKASSSWLGG